MRTVLALSLATLVLAGLPAQAEEGHAAAPSETAPEGAAVAAAPGYLPVALNVAGVDYAAEVTPHEGEPADLRLRRADGATMADQGYLLAELGLGACHQAGFRFDAAVPPTLGTDGSWTITGGCQ